MTDVYGLARVQVGESHNGERSAGRKALLLCRHRVLLLRHELKRPLLLCQLFRHSSSGACWQYWLKRPLIRHQLKALLLLLCSHRLLPLLFQHRLLLLPMMLLQHELKRPLLLCQLFRHWLTLISWGRSLCGIKTWLASGRSRLELPTLIRSKIKWGVKLSTAYGFL